MKLFLSDLNLRDGHSLHQSVPLGMSPKVLTTLSFQPWI